METWLSIAYVVCQMLSDIGSLRIVAPLGISFDAGTLVYPITFTLRDLIHRKTSKKFAQKIVVYAVVVNIIMALFFWIVGKLPPDMSVGIQQEFAMVLNPVWRITLASIVAEVISELLDTEVYHLFRAHSPWKRVLFSNSVSIPIDTLIFCTIAFYGSLDTKTLLIIIASNIVLKFIITIFSVPSIYAIKGE